MAGEVTENSNNFVEIDEPEDPYGDMTDEELAELIENTNNANDVLKHETEMFEKYLKRVQPEDADARAAELAAQQDAKKRSKKQKSKASEVLLQLTPEQKSDIAQHETDVLRNEMTKMNEDAEKVLDNYKASLEELDMWLAETKKGMYEFERDVCKGAVISDKSCEISAEKVIRFYEDKLKSRDTLIEKLRLKNTTMRVVKKKLAIQLKQKEEMGEVLHEVDFSQLKIENQQYLEKIDEKNQELLRLKLMAGNTLQVLNRYKKKLHVLTLAAEQIKTDIASKNAMLLRFESEAVQADEEHIAAQKRNMLLRKRISDYQVPDVQQYVVMKDELVDLRKTARTWERKVEVASMALKSQQREWKKIWQRHQGTSRNINPMVSETSVLFT